MSFGAAENLVDELKASIDFQITDCAGICATLLVNLGAEDGKILKCCAHITLGIVHACVHACDKVFREKEQIETKKLLELSAGHQALLLLSTSIHSLDQIVV